MRSNPVVAVEWGGPARLAQRKKKGCACYVVLDGRSPRRLSRKKQKGLTVKGIPGLLVERVWGAVDGMMQAVRKRATARSTHDKNCARLLGLFCKRLPPWQSPYLIITRYRKHLRSAIVLILYLPTASSAQAL